MKLYIVGAGPGDPDLITVKGLKLLQSADVVLYTDSLVNDELVAKAKPGAEVLQSSGMALEEMVGLLVDRIRQGKTVVRLHRRRSVRVRSDDGTNRTAERSGH